MILLSDQLSTEKRHWGYDDFQYFLRLELQRRVGEHSGAKAAIYVYLKTSQREVVCVRRESTGSQQGSNKFEQEKRVARGKEEAVLSIAYLQLLK